MGLLLIGSVKNSKLFTREKSSDIFQTNMLSVTGENTDLEW